MNCFRYKLDHDLGLAPNPFWGFMSLAVCKGDIRRNENLKVGDWIVGTGSVKLNCLNKLIYAMKVEKIIPFDEYWNDITYECKKPVINGSLAQMYGDNFYHTVNGVVIQEPSAHSTCDLNTNQEHLERDIKGENVLISEHFYYFGDKCPEIPQSLEGICCTSRNYQYEDIDEDLINRFVEWLESNYNVGIHGEPINWKDHENIPNLTEFEIYDNL